MDVMKSGTGALVTRRPQEPIPVIERYYVLSSPVLPASKSAAATMLSNPQ